MLCVGTDLVLERPPLEEGPQVLHGRMGDVGQCLPREEPLMRGDDHVVERQQPGQHVVIQNAVRGILVEVGRLLFVDVQPRGADPLLLQTVDQRLGMDQLPAARVDEHDTRLHLRDGHVADHVARRIGQRAVQRNNVRTVVELVERDIGDARRRGILRIGIEVIGQHLHAEPLEDADQLPGDPPRTDDPRRLAVKIETQQAVQREVAVARAPVGTVDLAVERQHQRHGVLRHGMRRIGRDPHHGHAAAGRLAQINVVEARTAQRQELHTLRRKRPHGLGVGRVVDEDADRIGPLRQRDVVDVQVAAMVADVEPVGVAQLFKRIAVVGLRTE